MLQRQQSGSPGRCGVQTTEAEAPQWQQQPGRSQLQQHRRPEGRQQRRLLLRAARRSRRLLRRQERQREDVEKRRRQRWKEHRRSAGGAAEHKLVRVRLTVAERQPALGGRLALQPLLLGAQLLRARDVSAAAALPRADGTARGGGRPPARGGARPPGAAPASREPRAPRPQPFVCVVPAGFAPRAQQQQQQRDVPAHQRGRSGRPRRHRAREGGGERRGQARVLHQGALHTDGHLKEIFYLCYRC